MKKSFFACFLFVLCFAVSIFAQENQPEVLKYIAPKFPPAAIATRTKGEVIIAVKINREGKVISAKVETGHPLLKKAAENAAEQWIFSSDKTINERIVKITFAFMAKYKKQEKVRFKKPYRVEIYITKPYIQTYCADC